MEIKLFEVRDRATCIPVMGIKLGSENPQEIFLLRRGGYGKEQITLDTDDPYIVLMKLDGIQAEHDPFAWSGGRTMRPAHLYIRDCWNSLETGAVIDVEYVLGETTKPKKSEAIHE